MGFVLVHHYSKAGLASACDIMVGCRKSNGKLRCWVVHKMWNCGIEAAGLNPGCHNICHFISLSITLIKPMAPSLIRSSTWTFLLFIFRQNQMWFASSLSPTCLVFFVVFFAATEYYVMRHFDLKVAVSLSVAPGRQEQPPPSLKCKTKQTLETATGSQRV